MLIWDIIIHGTNNCHMSEVALNQSHEIQVIFPHKYDAKSIHDNEIQQ
jgi:hypothetical protein